MDEGYIKFNCEWIKDDVITSDIVMDINALRNKLFFIKLIGAYDGGIGFGNISKRINDKSENDNNNQRSQFIITGSATGNFSRLNKKHYSIVIYCDIKSNKLTCKGQTKASSESMSHAAIYESCDVVNYVVHIHSLELWQKHRDKLPTTDYNAQYGTPEMAEAIVGVIEKESSKNPEFRNKGIIIMGGHKEGILIYGKCLGDVEGLIDKLFL